MPVAKGPSFSAGRALVFASVSLLLGIGLLGLVVWFAGSEAVEVRLGDDQANLGSAEARAESIRISGAPIILASQARELPVIVNHVGSDAKTGWFAFDGRSPVAPDECGLAWSRNNEVFTDPCDEGTTYSPTGEGLLQYTVTVNGSGNLVVDLNADPDADLSGDEADN